MTTRSEMPDRIADQSARPDDRQPRPPAEAPDKSGRPTGPPDPHGLRPGAPHEEVPTEAPEQEGGTPSTEHGPGGDL